MNFDEGVGDLIPKEAVPKIKEKRYKSKYPPNIYPTASTFNNFTTSRILGNLSGNYMVRTKPHFHVSGHATMGVSKGYNLDRPATNQLEYKSTNQTVIKQLKPKEKVPNHKEIPLLKINPEKNFIHMNITHQNQLQRGKSLPLNGKDFLKKKDYGKAPNYLNKIKMNIEKDFNMLQEIKAKEEEEKKKEQYSLKNEEIANLKVGLKKKWEILNNEYLKYAHIKKPDTEVVLKKKTNLENELKQIEKDLEKLNNKKLFVVQAKIK